MAQFPDVYCWIKLIDQPNGKVVSNGALVLVPPTGSVIIRYVVANDSNKPTGDFMISGILKKNGQSLPMPVPLTRINLQPKTLWKHEHTVNKNDEGNYKAVLQGDVKIMVSGIEEEDEKNNVAEATFGILQQPK